MELSTNITTLKVLEEELIKSEEAYRLLFNNDPSPIFVVNRTTLRSWTPMPGPWICTVLTRPRLTRKTFFDLVPEDYAGRTAGLFQERKTFLGKLKQLDQAGASFYVNLRCSEGVYRDTPVYIITTNDITERIQAGTAIDAGQQDGHPRRNVGRGCP